MDRKWWITTLVAIIAAFSGVILYALSLHGQLSDAKSKIEYENSIKQLHTEGNNLVKEIHKLRTSLPSVPVGSIIAMHTYGKTIEESDLSHNWVVCDGREITDPNCNYNVKFTPILTDRFLRGATKSGEFDGENTLSGSTTSAKGVDLNKHKHQTTINQWSGILGLKVGSPFGTGANSDTVKMRNMDVITINSVQSKGFHDRYKLTSDVYNGDLNNHQHKIDKQAFMPKCYTVVFVMRTS